MPLTRPHSVNFYIAVFSLTGIVLLAIIGVNMYWEMNKVEVKFKKTHSRIAANEFQRGVETVVSQAKSIIDRIAIWDESSQQLTDPTYYRFWRERRLQTIQFIPDYINVIELYDSNGNALLKPRDSLMPEKVPGNEIEIVFENKQPWLCLFKPIHRHQNSSEIFGYVGIKLNFLPALLKLNRFSHLDISSIRFEPAQKLKISPDTLVDYAKANELHEDEIDDFRNVTYKTFAYIVALIFVIFVLLYWLIIVLFAKPLNQLNRYIQTTSRLPINGPAGHQLTHFPLDEFNNFSRSLQQYQLELHDTQEDLHKLNNDLEQRVVERTAELESKNRELEAFSYSVSHDLRSPLRSIDGFSQLLLQEYYNDLNEEGRDYLRRIRASTQNMAQLIDDLLNLARISRVDLEIKKINISEIARKKLKQLLEQNPERSMTVSIKDNLHVHADEKMISVLLDNLIDNAWKYTSKTINPVIEIGSVYQNNKEVFYIRDNGIGFEMKYVHKIYEVFQRLHTKEYEGTGIGLATVKRIIMRHGGHIWAESTPNEGSCFYFTL